MKPISALIALALIVGVPLLAWMIWAAWEARRKKQDDQPEALAPEVEVSSNVIGFRRRHWPDFERRNIL